MWHLCTIYKIATSFPRLCGYSLQPPWHPGKKVIWFKKLQVSMYSCSVLQNAFLALNQKHHIIRLYCIDYIYIYLYYHPRATDFNFADCFPQLSTILAT